MTRFLGVVSLTGVLFLASGAYALAVSSQPVASELGSLQSVEATPALSAPNHAAAIARVSRAPSAPAISIVIPFATLVGTGALGLLFRIQMQRARRVALVLTK